MKKTALELACDELSLRTGDCPASDYDFNVNGGCENVCMNDISACWREYFILKSKESK